MTQRHKYEGGVTLPRSTPQHYHVDYWTLHPGVEVGSDGWFDKAVYRDGYIIDVKKKFEVFDSWSGNVIAKTLTLKEAVIVCFEKYKEKYPNMKIVPVFGAGAANDTLAELGYKL